MTTEATEDDMTINLDMRCRPSNSDEVTLRQIGLGLNPMILIEFDTDSTSSLGVKVDSTSFEVNELAEMLEVIAEAIRDGYKKHLEQ